MKFRMRPAAPHIRLLNLLAVAFFLMVQFVHRSAWRDFFMGFGTVMLAMQIIFMRRSSNCTRTRARGPM